MGSRGRRPVQEPDKRSPSDLIIPASVTVSVKLLADNQPILTPPKGGRTREVPLPDTVATELAEHLRSYPPQQDGRVSTTRERKPLNRNHIAPHVWKKALRAAGIDPSRINGCVSGHRSGPRGPGRLL